MYISFSDTNETAIGGAAQGIIPVQDGEGNLLGGSAPASPDARQVRRDAREAKVEESKFGEQLQKMMQAMEQNTAQIAALAEKQQPEPVESRNGDRSRDEEGYFSEVSSHLARVNDLLERNSAHVEDMAKRQSENEQKLNSALQDLSSRQKNDYLDMSQLSSHLDRIQSLMEQSANERKDSARGFTEQQQQQQPPPQPVQIDFSPLTDRLEKVQQAVEQNSTLVKALLDEGAAGSDSKPSTPFWGKDTPVVPPLQPAVDLTPLAEHLENIHSAITQQSNHMQALVGFATGGEDERPASSGGSGGGDTGEKSLAPLGEHLEQIYNAIEEGNKRAREQPQLDLKPLLEAQERTREAVEAGAKLDLLPLIEHLKQLHTAVEQGIENARELLQFDLTSLIEAQNATREAVAARGKVDVVPLKETLERMSSAIEEGNRHAKSLPQLDLQPLLDVQDKTREAVERSSKIDMEPLKEHFERLHRAVEDGNEQARYMPQLDLKPLLDAQNATREALEAGSKVDLEPLVEHFERLHRAVEEGNKQARDVPQLDLQPLLDALNKTREAVEAGSKPVMDLAPLQEHFDRLHRAVEESNQQAKGVPQLDLKPLLDAHNATRAALEATGSRPAMDVTPLIEAQNATRDAIEASSNKEALDISPLTERLDGLIAHFASLHQSSRHTDEELQVLIRKQNELQAAMSESSSGVTDFAPLAEKLDGVNEHLESLREWSEHNAEQFREIIDAQNATLAASEAGKSLGLAPLTGRIDVLSEHLEALLTSSDKNAESLRQMVEAQQQQVASAAPPPPPTTEIDFTPLTDRLTRIHTSLEQQTQHRRDSSPGNGDPKFIMSALASHLSRIQGVTEANAQHVKALREKPSSTDDNIRTAVSEMASQVRSLASVRASQEQRLEATNSQVRELMAGQREMVDVMRELATSITAQQKGACDHVVIPPPRKVGRKIVGFVYDAKDRAA